MKFFVVLAILSATAVANKPLITSLPSWGEMTRAYAGGVTNTYVKMGIPPQEAERWMRSPAWKNTCAARISYMFMKLGVIPTVTGCIQNRQCGPQLRPWPFVGGMLTQFEGKWYPLYVRVNDYRDSILQMQYTRVEKGSQSSGLLLEQSGLIVFSQCSWTNRDESPLGPLENAKRDEEEEENSGGGETTQHIDLWNCHRQVCEGNGQACRRYARDCKDIRFYVTGDRCRGGKPSSSPSPSAVVTPTPSPKTPTPPTPPSPTIPTLTPVPTPQPTPRPPPRPPGIPWGALEDHYDYKIKYGDLKRCMMLQNFEKIDAKCQLGCIDTCWPEYVKKVDYNEIHITRKILESQVEVVKKCKTPRPTIPRKTRPPQTRAPEQEQENFEFKKGQQQEEGQQEEEGKFNFKKQKRDGQTEDEEQPTKRKRPDPESADDVEIPVTRNPKRYFPKSKVMKLPGTPNPVVKAVNKMENRQIKQGNLRVEQQKIVDEITRINKPRDHPQVVALLAQLKVVTENFVKQDVKLGQAGLSACLNKCVAGCKRVTVQVGESDAVWQGGGVLLGSQAGANIHGGAAAGAERPETRVRFGGSGGDGEKTKFYRHDLAGKHAGRFQEWEMNNGRAVRTNNNKPPPENGKRDENKRRKRF